MNPGDESAVLGVHPTGGLYPMIYTDTDGLFRTPRGTPVRLHYRELTNDWNVLYSALNEDEYGLRERYLGGLALDIGAHIGGVTVGLAIDNPELHVIAVEPVPDNARLLRWNVAENGLGDRVTVIEGATGRGEVPVQHGFRGSESALHHAFVGNSSLLVGNSSLLVGEGDYDTITYPGLTLGDLAYADVALLKIDNEGGEYDFLDDPLVSLCEVIVGEWHNVGGHVQGDTAALLGATHDVTFSGPVAGPGGFLAVRR